MKNLQIIIHSKCQYDCFYCPHKAGMSSLENISHDHLLRLCDMLAQDGVENVELTGGNPLLYEGIEKLIGDLKNINGIRNVYITTNGLALDEKVDMLKRAGIAGINIHVDTIASEEFTQITGCEKKLNDVLKGIWRAVAADIPVVITVALHELSVGQSTVMAGLAKQMPVIVRFASIGGYSEGISREVIQKKIMVSAGGEMETEGSFLIPKGWKGKITFGNGISGAFGMEQAFWIGGNVIDE